MLRGRAAPGKVLYMKVNKATVKNLKKTTSPCCTAWPWAPPLLEGARLETQPVVQQCPELTALAVLCWAEWSQELVGEASQQGSTRATEAAGSTQGEGCAIAVSALRSKWRDLQLTFPKALCF